MKNCAYIFLDESGDTHSSCTSTRFFVLTSVSMYRPFLIIDAMDNYKHHCLEAGRDIEYFHCSNDKWKTRDDLFDLIASHIDDMRINYLVFERSNSGMAADEDTHLYPEMLGRLLQSVIPTELDRGAEEVVVITDTIPVQAQKKAMKKAIRTTLAKMLPSGMKYTLLHHRSRSHYGLQVADYCCWAVFQKWERGCDRWYDRIEPAVSATSKKVDNFK